MASSERELTLRFLAQPKDVNYGGKAFGGAVMGWIDQAAYALAAGWSGHYAVTVYVGGIQFEAPVPIGSLVEVRARMLYTGSSSMHIGVDVHARDPRCEAGTRRRTTHCIVVFVAMDTDGKPIAVPALTSLPSSGIQPIGVTMSAPTSAAPTPTTMAAPTEWAAST